MPQLITKADALALAGNPVANVGGAMYPNVNPEKAMQETYGFYRDLVDMATGRPRVDANDWAPPISYLLDFIDTATPKATTTGGLFDVAANTQAWFVTEVDGGTGQSETVIGIPIDGAAGASAQGGWGAFTTCNADNDSLNAQLNGESFKLAVGKPLWFETKLAIDDISITELFIGLAISTTSAYGTAGAGDTGGHVGFAIKADGAILFNVMESGGTLTATDTTKDFVDGSITTFETANVVHRLGFYWDGVDTITPYVDGEVVAGAVTDAVGSEVPDGVCMSPVFNLLTNTTSSATIWLDYISVNQKR